MLLLPTLMSSNEFVNLDVRSLTMAFVSHSRQWCYVYTICPDCTPADRDKFLPKLNCLNKINHQSMKGKRKDGCRPPPFTACIDHQSSLFQFLTHSQLPCHSCFACLALQGSSFQIWLRKHKILQTNFPLH